MGSLSFDFYKYVGCGNDFIIIDVRCNELVKFDSVSLPHFSQSICDRNYGVGADGLLVALKSTKADVKMEIYNRDGSVASMCGNGIRCFARWFRTFVTSSSNCLKIETSAGIFTAQFEDNLVKVEMPSLVKARYNIPLQLENSSANVHFLLVGVPHAVVL